MLYTLLVMLVIPFSLLWMTYNPLVQTFLARMAGSYLSERLNTVVKIDGLYITPRLDLNASGALVLDSRSDTLFYAGDLFMDMASFRIRESTKVFKVNDIRIEDAYFALVKGVNDSAFTYSFIRDHFETADKEVEVDTIHGSTAWQMSLSALKLADVRFRYTDENRVPKEVGMDYKNLDIYIHNLHMRDLNILNDTFRFAIDQMHCRDRCGFEVNELSGVFRLSPLFLGADSLRVITPNSKLDLDLDFRYTGWPSYINFTSEVNMRSLIRPSELNMKDIGYFAPDMLVMDNRLRIGGRVDGKVNNLRMKDFLFTYGQNTRFVGDVKLYGLPDVRETFLFTSVKEFSITPADIKTFSIPGTYRHIPVPEELEVFGKMKINGNFTGFYNDFVSSAEFVTDIGLLKTDLSLTQNEDHSDVSYQGEIHAQRFDIGKFLQLEDYLGELDLDAVVTGTGITGETVDMNISGAIDSLEFMQNSFNQVEISGDIADRRFNGHLEVKDDLVDLIFDGMLDFRSRKPVFDFTADVQDADLFKLNMLDRDSVSMLSAMLNVNFIGFEIEDIEGRIRIDSLHYTEGEKEWAMDHLALISLKDTGYHRRVLFTSDFMDAKVEGNFTTPELLLAADSALERIFSPWSFMLDPDPDIRPQDIEFAFESKETEDLLEIFTPGLYLERKSTLKGQFKSPTGKLDVDVVIPHINYQGMQSDSLRISARGNPGSIRVDLATDRILLKERERGDTLQLGLEKFVFNAVLENDSLLFGLGWNDHDEQMQNMADIRGYYTYSDSVMSELFLTRAEAVINDAVWSWGKGGRMLFARNYMAFERIAVYSGRQQLSLHGAISEDPADTLKIDFADWRLSNFDIIYRNYNFDLNGVVNGKLGMSNVYKSPNFYSGLYLSDLEMNEIPLGDASINSLWNNSRESIDLNAEIIYQGNIGDSKVLTLNGSYFPLRKSDNLNFRLELNNFRMETMSRFIDEYVGGLKGIASGSFYIGGSTQKPTLEGKLKLMRTRCRINYLNTHYSLGHTFDFDKRAIRIENLVLYDTIGNTSVVNGIIRHKNLSDFNFDILLKADKFIFLNTNRYQNKVFYGKGIVDGNVRFYGPPDDFHIDADVVTSKGTDIVIPLNNSFTVTENDFVVFRNVEKEDDPLRQDYNVELKGLSLDFRIKITNTAELKIYLPGNMGNINSKGYGDIRLTVNPRGQFNIYGDYNFLHGTFFFSLQNLINRRFEIQQGGTIDFNGNPYAANLNLRALYRLKTTLSGLGASISPEFEGQRVNVNTYLGLRGRIADPDIHFSIDFPNVNDDVKQTIYAVLDTNDAASMNQQMVSLLLMNNFSYASTPTNMSASSFNIISSQLSNWLSQISRDFDIGINYIPGDEINQDELEVALSTQFFDDRLVIDGNVGVMTKDKAAEQQATNIVGDVNIEYKLRPDGRIRLRAFNRSNNFNSIDYYAPYTQGVGIFYTKEFDRFRDIFRRKPKKPEEPQNEEN